MLWRKVKQAEWTEEWCGGAAVLDLLRVLSNDNKAKNLNEAMLLERMGSSAQVEGGLDSK